MNSSSVNLLLSEVRSGSREALAKLLEQYRPMLLNIASKSIPLELAGKVSPSDAVQETAMDAVRSVHDLRATSEAECRAWFCALLFRNIEDASRKFVFAQMREVGREQPLSTDDSRNLAGLVPGITSTPLEHMLGREEGEQFEVALRQLSQEHRKIIELHSRDGLSFVDIAALYKKSPDAVRMTWKRAVAQLTRELRNARPQ
jgi:RNA polymerase sigma-70 factor (subfamily 1)